MALIQEVNPITLYPKNAHAREMLLTRLSSKAVHILTLSTMFATIGFFFNTIIALSSDQGFFEAKENYVPVITDGARGVYYLVMLILAKNFPSIGFVGTWSVPVVFSVAITESLIYLGAPELIYIRFC